MCFVCVVLFVLDCALVSSVVLMRCCLMFVLFNVFRVCCCLCGPSCCYCFICARFVVLFVFVCFGSFDVASCSVRDLYDYKLCLFDYLSCVGVVLF